MPQLFPLNLKFEPHDVTTVFPAALAGSGQAAVIFGRETVLDDTDEAAVFVTAVKDVFLGGMHAKLLKELREKRGLAYSAAAVVGDARAHNARGVTYLMALTAADDADEAAKVFATFIENIVANPQVDADELRHMKVRYCARVNNLIRDFEGFAGVAANWARYHRPGATRSYPARMAGLLRAQQPTYASPRAMIEAYTKEIMAMKLKQFKTITSNLLRGLEISSVSGTGEFFPFRRIYRGP